MDAYSSSPAFVEEEGIELVIGVVEEEGGNHVISLIGIKVYMSPQTLSTECLIN
jgi:hypothetical protein